MAITKDDYIEVVMGFMPNGSAQLEGLGLPADAQEPDWELVPIKKDEILWVNTSENPKHTTLRFCNGDSAKIAERKEDFLKRLFEE